MKVPPTSTAGHSVRRCRPLLGTFVEITVTATDVTRLVPALEAAFASVERVQHLMSAHDEESELSRVNADAFTRPVQVSDEPFEVLQRGLELSRASDGAFDFTIAPLLARWGMLPALLRRRAGGTWRDVVLQHGRRVSFARPLAIDLGGIAKGFAVDAAMAALRAHRVSAATVNAGGDLRVFGADATPVHLRHPVSARPMEPHISLLNAALATSSPCFTRRRWRGKTVSHLINPLNRQAVITRRSVSVRAGECWLADALTKIVWNAPAAAPRLLEAYEAEAWILTA